MEEEPEVGKNKLKRWCQVAHKPRAKGRRVDEQRFERLALFFECARADADLLAVHVQQLPAFPVFWLVARVLWHRS